MKTILKFYSPTCGPCKVVSRNLEQIEGAEIKSIDVTDSTNKELLDKYNIITVPTIIILGEDGEVQSKFKGIVTADEIKEVL